MKCGSLGHKTIHGLPCQQDISHESKGCIWHVSDAAQRQVVARLAQVRRLTHKKLPDEYPVPEFTNLETIVTFAHKLAKVALTGTVDPRRVSEARQCAGLALSAFQAQDQKRLVDAVVRLQHGEAAVLLLQRMTESVADGRKKPLPGRMLAAHVEPGNGEPQ